MWKIEILPSTKQTLIKYNLQHTSTHVMASMNEFKCYSNELYINNENKTKDIIAKLQSMIAEHDNVLKNGDRYDQAESMDNIFNTLVTSCNEIPDWTVEKLWKQFRSRVAHVNEWRVYTWK